MFFDASEYVEEVKCLPVGVEYPATVTAVTEGVSKAKQTPYIQIEFTVIGDDYKGWKIRKDLWQTDACRNMNMGFLKSFNNVTDEINESFETKAAFMNHFLEKTVNVTMKTKAAFGDWPASSEFKKMTKYDVTKTNNAGY